jgi:predicted ATP-grasp superfamily ATP-dependent carboligase
VSIKALLVIAVSARAYVVAAKRAGYQVTAIDGFADKETLDCADQALIVEYNSQGFDANALLNTLKALDVSQYLGCIYGSGFEMQPALLSAIAQIIPLLGNAADVVRQVKNPPVFFKQLEACNIEYPQLLDANAEEYKEQVLVKTQGGCGGGHIQWQADFSQSVHLSATHNQQYTQAYVDGLSISVLFLAGIAEAAQKDMQTPVCIIGFNEQWLNPTHDQPFRFGGLVSQVQLNAEVTQLLTQHVMKVAQLFGLVGLNSLDVIVQENRVFVLEVNPRLSASFDLYAEDWLMHHDVDLMDLHIKVCRAQYAKLGAEVDTRLDTSAVEAINHKVLECANRQIRSQVHGAKASAIMYAEQDMPVGQCFDWPEGVVDTPVSHPVKTSTLLSNQTIENKQSVYFQFKKDQPVCTVMSCGSNAAEAKYAVEAKMQSLRKQLYLK